VAAPGALALALAFDDVGTGGSLLALVSGLLLAGAGIGICFAPLTGPQLRSSTGIGGSIVRGSS
jgi:hypothetical protein